MADAYGLRAFTAADLPVMAQWLNPLPRVGTGGAVRLTRWPW